MSRRVRASHLVGLLAAGVLAAAGCGRPSPPTTPTADVPTGIRFLAAEPLQDAEFARATAPRAFRFPDDHGPHPSYRTEWWYFTGNVESAAGNHYGFELTLFRYTLSPAPPGPDTGSAWSTNQVYMGHLAVTDTRGGRFLAEERLARGAVGLAGATSEPLEIWVENWRIEGGHYDGVAAFTLDARGERIGLRLDVEAMKPPVFHGDRGVDPKGPEPGNASYYYSLTRLAARGSITVDGRVEEVDGHAWMDREWSTSALSPDVEGWDWFAIQLDDGRDLMLYRLRRHDGSTSPFSGGSLVAPGGERTALGPDDFVLEPLAHWRSRRSGVRYPIAWRASLPRHGLELEVRPVLDEQEILLGVRYWEGAVRVSGLAYGEAISGRGYVELAGYR